MELKLICKRLVIAGTVLIWLIKYAIRPLHLFAEPLSFFLGVAPNFLGSFLLPFGAYWFFSGKSYLAARLFQINTAYDIRNVCLTGFLLLVANEYLQRMPVFGRTFDYNDIVFSAIGLFAAYFVFEKLRQRIPVKAG